MFGLFKKETKADTVFINGNIYTQDADIPWAEAVACAEGKIIDVGNSDEMERLISEDTYVVDLEGKYMLPGLINTHSHPALRIFQDTYIEISDTADLEEVLACLSDYVSNNPEEEAYFGYGMADNLIKELSREDAMARLDEICSDKPILVLSIAERDLWVNTLALEEAQEAAKADGMMQISIPYFLQAVAPFDYEELQERTINLISEYCERGFTSIFNAGCPEFMNSIYHDMLMEMCQQEIIKQRNFESLKTLETVGPQVAVNRLMQKKTAFTELDDYVHCNALKLVLSEKAEGEKLKPLFEAVAERDFDIHIDLNEHRSFVECMKAVTAVRDAGYRKNNIIIACEEELRRGNDELPLEDMCMDNVYFRTSTQGDVNDEYGALVGAGGMEEAIDRLTIEAAELLGMSEKLGSIEKGKLADFTVFEENPFELHSLNNFKKLTAEMTVVGGNVAYDAEEENMQEWYSLMNDMRG